MQFLLNLLTRVQLPVLYAIGRGASFVAYHVLRWRIGIAATNLRNAFPERSEAERMTILRQSYRNLGDLLAETFHGYAASADEMRSRVRLENPEVLTDWTDRGQSVVLLAAHFCNWEWLLLSASVQLGVPIDAVYKPQHVAFFDRFMRDGRARFGGNPIPHRSVMFEIAKRKGQARVYALVADQTPLREEEKHWTWFLNQDTAFYVGADKIARILKAPVLFVTMRREARGRYAARLEVLALPPYERSAERDIGALVIERYARALEAEIRECPADWLWIHRKWKYPKPLYA
ncbi:MAG: lysophospholipid acyltransferase family protein [Betaproteobacteria bacterium]